MPNHQTRRSALTAALLLLCATSLGAQATAGGAAGEPPTGVRRGEVERELARHQAERSRLIAHIESLAGRLESSDALDPRQRRQLQGELERMVKRLTEMHARVGMDVGVRLLDGESEAATMEVRRVLGETQRRFATAARAGYVGITLSPTNNRVRVLPGGRLFVRYFDYPAIISVDPSSPAERAGLARGDTVLAYNGFDVRRELPMHELLDAGRPVRVSVRRDGRERTVRLVVAPPPAVVQGRREEFFVPAHETAPRPRLAPIARPGERVVAPSPPAVPLSPMYHFDFARGLAGAELKALTEGLAAAVGVRKGLLVMSVAPRSPAAHAGLRDGDIILSANGREVPEIAALSRVMRESDDARAVDLKVRREKKTRTVRLTW